MKKILILIVLVAPLILASCKPTPEEPENSTNQEGIATIYGFVIDASTHAPIQGALITIMPGSVNKYTGSDGTYQFDNLKVSASILQYTLTAKIDGFNPDRKTIDLESGAVLEVNFALQPK